jgi:hypothetical protein
MFGKERGRDMADVAHGKLRVALGQGQKLVQWCWLVLRHNSDSRGIATSEQAHLASLTGCKTDLALAMLAEERHKRTP